MSFQFINTLYVVITDFRWLFQRSKKILGPFTLEFVLLPCHLKIRGAFNTIGMSFVHDVSKYKINALSLSDTSASDHVRFYWMRKTRKRNSTDEIQLRRHPPRTKFISSRTADYLRSCESRAVQNLNWQQQFKNKYTPPNRYSSGLCDATSSKIRNDVNPGVLISAYSKNG